MRFGRNQAYSIWYWYEVKAEVSLIVRKLNQGRYELEKVGEYEGFRSWNTVSECMKPWSTSFGSNNASGRPNVVSHKINKVSGLKKNKHDKT